MASNSGVENPDKVCKRMIKSPELVQTPIVSDRYAKPPNQCRIKTPRD